MVCPYYAQRRIAGLHECGVHVFDRDHSQRLAADDIDRRIMVRGAPLTNLRLEVPT